MTTLHVTVTGDKEWARRTKETATNIGKIAVKPVFEQLSKSLMLTLRTLFAPGGSPGAMFQHGYTGNYGNALRSEITNDALKVIEGTPDGGGPILTGTSPVSRMDSSGNPIIPGGVVAWAVNKLGVSQREAFAIGRSVAANGIGAGSSPLQLEPPVGEGRMTFPEWTIEQNRNEIEDAAEKIGGLVVSYLDR